MKGILPSRVIIAADEEYSNEMNIITPHGGRNRDEFQSNCDHFISRCRVKIEQAFGLLENSFGIFWSPIGFRLHVATKIIGVCAKLQNYIIDMEVNHSNDLEIREENDVTGSPNI